MRTIPSSPNYVLRDAMRAHQEVRSNPDRRDAALDALLASTIAITHDGSVHVAHGQLPKDQPLSFHVAQDAEGGLLLTAFSDHQAMIEPEAPTEGGTQPVIALAGDDLVMLAARNDLGLLLNPGSAVSMAIPLSLVRQAARRVEKVRHDAGVRVVNKRTLVTMRERRFTVDPAVEQLLASELRGRGIRLAYLVEYAEHDRRSEPGEFKPLVVVAHDETGEAQQEMLADARTVCTYATGALTDAVAFASMPLAEQVADPLLALDAERPKVRMPDGAIV
jgi:hypothetical protein